jgi:putative transposase
MAKPLRCAAQALIPAIARVYFATSRTAAGRPVLQSAAMANLFIDVLRRCTADGVFKVSEFVVMRNHFHALVRVNAGMTIEKAVQLIKGGFSYRAKKELGFSGEIWQRGFSDVRVDDRESYVTHVEYIYRNPVRAGYVSLAEEYAFCSAYFRRMKRERVRLADAEGHG